MVSQTVISDEQARVILERAAAIDRSAAERVSIETLRAAAREAGIAESSFDAALGECTREKARDHGGLARRRLLVGALAGAGGSALLLLGFALITRIVL